MKQTLLSLLMILLPIIASAEIIKIDGIWYNLVTKLKEAEVTRDPSVEKDRGCYSGSIQIPSSINYGDVNYSVTSIGEAAFYRSTGLTSITIPNNVTEIKGGSYYNGAFQECTNLRSVILPDNIKK